MSLNLFTRTTLAMTGTLLSVGTVAINPASAARITYDFSGYTYEGPGGYGPIPLTGRFSYDEATEVNTFSVFEDPIRIGPWGSHTWEIQRYEVEVKQYEVDFIEFYFLDKVYTQSDAIYPIYWTIDYLKGENDPIGSFLYWATEDFLFKGDRYNLERWTSFYSAGPHWTGLPVEFSRVKEEPISVPEPTLLGGLSVLGLAGLLGKKRRKAQSVE
ncbi:PEP-CTERM sorting domain-containing protein [Laspinema palackyanum]|uniref:PEP-CTERM sorting domain-containing protein n=1 Tax=Laspinema palackyanum TaxID=3231601 RepID=UPI00345D2C8C|nr:PEP-CTERM sorting domain-containing protein [Laspinema sp. D2c]